MTILKLMLFVLYFNAEEIRFNKLDHYELWFTDQSSEGQEEDEDNEELVASLGMVKDRYANVTRLTMT